MSLSEQGWAGVTCGRDSPLGKVGEMWIWVTASAAKERSWSEPQDRIKPLFLDP